MKLIKSIWNFFKKIFSTLVIVLFGVIIFIYVSHAIETKLDYFTSIINGIISGVVTALIIFIVQIIWRKNVLVWIENLLYQDVCIEGEWSGFLIPYMGLDDLDKLSKDIAWRKFKEMHKSNRTDQNRTEKTKPVEATVYDEKTGNEEKISAEIVLPDIKDKDTQEPNEGNNKKKIEINISPVPIIVKVEIKRVGHQISGKMIEIGGASQVCSYTISGTFKNLILSGCYETTSKDNIDRGALSLMLFENGKKLDGFFSSYSDGKHRIAPMQCMLRKRNQLTDSDDNE